jgi:hypothetical protein
MEKVQLVKNGTDLSDAVFADTPEQEKAFRKQGYLFYGEKARASASKASAAPAPGQEADPFVHPSSPAPVPTHAAPDPGVDPYAHPK